MYSLFSPSKSHRLTYTGKRSSAGFGLIELLVSISIMAIVSGIVLARQTSFNGAVLLRGEAYNVAFTAREVQLMAVSATGFADDFRTLLGLHFDTTIDDRFVVFRDADDDGYYDVGETYGAQGSLDGRFEVREIRTFGDTFSGTAVSVVFQRPNFDAAFYDINGEVDASSIEIDIARRDGSGDAPDVVRTVEITSTGQISVQ